MKIETRAELNAYLNKFPGHPQLPTKLYVATRNDLGDSHIATIPMYSGMIIAKNIVGGVRAEYIYFANENGFVNFVRLDDLLIIEHERDFRATFTTRSEADEYIAPKPSYEIGRWYRYANNVKCFKVVYTTDDKAVLLGTDARTLNIWTLADLHSQKVVQHTGPEF